MAEGINVRFTGTLQNFIQERVEGTGLYNSASEYIRDLVRRDYEQEQVGKWNRLRETLKDGLQADASAFKALDAETVIAKAKARRRAHGR
jgi:antitoxin ParD1/3/4